MRRWRGLLLLVPVSLQVAGGCGNFGASEDVAPGAVQDGGASPADGAASQDGGTEAVNFARLGSATATSVHPPDADGTYTAENAIDGKPETSWYADYKSCGKTADSGAELVCTTAPTIDVRLDALRTIGRVKVVGNRGPYGSGWDVLRLRLELLGDAGESLYSVEKATTRGAEPNGDVDQIITPAKADVRTVRIVVLTAEKDDPGLAEIEAYER
jgi:hypothetical protein